VTRRGATAGGEAKAIVQAVEDELRRQRLSGDKPGGQRRHAG